MRTSFTIDRLAMMQEFAVTIGLGPLLGGPWLVALGADENGLISRRCHRVGRLPAGEVFSLRADPRLAVWTRHHDAAPGYLQEFLPGASLLGRDREIDKTDL